MTFRFHADEGLVNCSDSCTDFLIEVLIRQASHAHTGGFGGGLGGNASSMQKNYLLFTLYLQRMLPQTYSQQSIRPSSLLLLPISDGPSTAASGSAIGHAACSTLVNSSQFQEIFFSLILEIHADAGTMARGNWKFFASCFH